VITVEPIISMGAGTSFTPEDGWTERTADGCLSAHFEHTIVITDRAPMLLTAVSLRRFENGDGRRQKVDP
jgi:methionyl aminopeptidase